MDVEAPAAGTQALSRYGFDDLYVVVGVNDLARQRKEGFRFRTDRPALPLVFPLDWAADENANWNWNVQLHCWRMLDPYLAEWFRTGRHSLLREAFAIARDWWDYHAEGRTARFSWYDMATGIRAMRIALLFEQWRIGRLRLGREDANRLLAMFDAHARNLMDPANHSLTNHGIFQVMGLRLLCDAGPGRPSVAGGVAVANDHLQRIVADLFTAEGIEKEHSPGYHYFVTNLVRRLDLPRWFPSLGAAQEVLARADANRDWLMYPDCRLSRIGDTRDNDDLDAPPAPRRIAGTEATAEVAGRVVEVGDFSASGWVIIRSWSPDGARVSGMLFMTAMHHSTVHKQADDLSIELYERDRHILIDPGHYAFSPNDAMKRYITSATAHNTVDLAELPLQRRWSKPYGTGLRPVRVAPDAIILSGHVPRRAGRLDHQRTVRYVPGRLVRIFDRVRTLDGRDHALVTRLHLAPDLTIGPQGKFFVVRGPEGRVARIHPPAGLAVSLVRGQEDPPLGWTTVGYGKVAPVQVVEARIKAREAVFVWRIEIEGRTG